MKTVCASSVLQGKDAFASLGEVLVLPEREIGTAALAGADALITRSKVRVDRALLEGTSVSFAATATAGTDHMDLAWLERRGIAWYAAAGCNANSVAEYLVAALLTMAGRGGFRLAGRTIAVVGVGHVGSRVVRMAGALGMTPLLNDPPLRDATGDTRFRALEDILPQADIVTLHVPLTQDGPHPTARLASTRFFERLKPGCVFCNASRGEVVDEDALLGAMRAGRVARAALDVFEGEPGIRADVLAAADIATPHIAGYSFEGRLNGTVQCYEAACRRFGLASGWRPAGSSERVGAVVVEASGRGDEDVLREVVRGAYDIESDDRLLREGAALDAAGRKAHFRNLRAKYHERHEFHRYGVEARHPGPGLLEKLAGLGFRLEAQAGDV
jgi:erythronate-4-phosphate dehydrogenase